MASDHDRIEVVCLVRGRPSRMSQSNLGGGFGIVLGGEFPGVRETVRGDSTRTVARSVEMPYRGANRT